MPCCKRSMNACIPLLKAVGGNEQSALMMGLPGGGRTKVLVYGFCAALGGVLFAIYMLSGYIQRGAALGADQSRPTNQAQTEVCTR